MTRNFSVLCGSSLQICQGVPLSSPSTPRTQAWVLKASPSPSPPRSRISTPNIVGSGVGEAGQPGTPQPPAPGSLLPSETDRRADSRRAPPWVACGLEKGCRGGQATHQHPLSSISTPGTWAGFTRPWALSVMRRTLKPAPSEDSLWPQELKGSVAPRVVQAAASGLGPAPLLSSSPSSSSPTGLGALGPWVSCPQNTVCCLLGRRRAQVLGSEATERIGWGWTCPP